MKDKDPPESVAAVVFNKENNDVLLIKRRDVPMWALPGGGIDPGESPEEAVVREVYEETGLRVKISRHVAVYTPINRLARVTYLYECRPLHDGVLLQGEETREVGFFPLDKLPEPFFFLHADWIADTRKDLPEVITKVLSNITYFELFKYFLRDPVPVLRIILSRLGFPLNNRN